MSDKLKKLMHTKIDQMNDIFSNVDQFFQQFDFYHSTIYDLIIAMFSEEDFAKQNSNLLFENNFMETKKINDMQFKNPQSVVVKSSNLSNQIFHDSYNNQEQHINDIVHSGKQISNSLRNTLDQYITELEQKDKTNYYSEKNKKLKQKNQNLQNKIEILQKENFDLKLENTKLSKVDEQVLQNQKSFITTYNEQGVDPESYQKVKDKNFALEKQNYFLQLKTSTLENQLSQIQQKCQQLQKYIQELQDEYLSLFKTTQKAISNNEIDVQQHFTINDDDTLQNQTVFTEISAIQNDRKKSDIDPILIDKLLNQQNELLQYFNSEDRRENYNEQSQETRPLDIRNIEQNQPIQNLNKNQTNIDTKKKFEELFSEKEFLNVHATKRQSEENFNKSEGSYDSKEPSEEDNQDLFNTQQSHNRKDSEDKHILRGFGDLGSFRSPVVQNEVQANIKKIKQSLRNQQPEQQQQQDIENEEDFDEDEAREEFSEARYSVVEMRNSKEENEEGFFNQENIFLNQFFLQCKEQEDQYQTSQTNKIQETDQEVKDIQIEEPKRRQSKFRTKIQIY